MHHHAKLISDLSTLPALKHTKPLMVMQHLIHSRLRTRAVNYITALSGANSLHFCSHTIGIGLTLYSILDMTAPLLCTLDALHAAASTSV